MAGEYLWSSGKLAAQSYYDELRIGWKTSLPTWEVLDRARSLRASGFSHWDSLLIAACLDAGVTTLYSEDFQAGIRVESLRIVNPFE